MSTDLSGEERFNIVSERPFFASAPKHRPDVIAHRGGAGEWHSRFLGVPVITRSFVKRAKSLDLVVHGWTVNRPREMKRMIKLGVDGIITDYPTKLLKILGRI